MQLDLHRTIVAVSSGLAPAARAIVRLSGRDTGDLLRRLIVTDGEADQSRVDQLLSTPWATSAHVRCGLSWKTRTVPARVYFWPDARSFTGEPCAEIHFLGSLPIVESLVGRLTELGAAPANRGEFTLRGFLAGKLDLTQAEAILGVIEADGPSQLNTALEQLGGNLSRPVRHLRDELLQLVAHLEAGLDFVEEDIEFITEQALAGALSRIAEQLQLLSRRLESRGTGSRRRHVVLIGLPNAGKSSLFNALLGKDRAIVTAQAGTTRDAIAEITTVDDLPIELIDTAGIEQLREDSPRALAQGVLAARIAQADALLFCVDLASPPAQDWLDGHLRELRHGGTPVLMVGTKFDLLSPQGAGRTACPVDLEVSPQLPSTIEKLRARLAELLATSHAHSHSDAMHHAAIRCKSSIDLASAAIAQALELLSARAGEELVAAELRCALDDLSSVIGEVHTEDILGEIFSRFCIGK